MMGRELQIENCKVKIENCKSKGERVNGEGERAKRFKIEDSKIHDSRLKIQDLRLKIRDSKSRDSRFKIQDLRRRAKGKERSAKGKRAVRHRMDLCQSSRRATLLD